MYWGWQRRAGPSYKYSQALNRVFVSMILSVKPELHTSVEPGSQNLISRDHREPAAPPHLLQDSVRGSTMVIQELLVQHAD